jgi:tRNA A-37 threonylcarbamoyl transferase component Bud32
MLRSSRFDIAASILADAEEARLPELCSAIMSSRFEHADPLGLVRGTVDDLRFDECIDAGGFGTLYCGWHLGRDERVAIKCLSPSRLPNLTTAMHASIVTRFRERTKIAQRLSEGSSDIVRCISSGQLFAPATGEPVLYLVLEWLEGRTLRADLAERRARGMPGRTLHEALDVIEGAALAIAHAHGQGVIHRDITPANLLLTRTADRLKVLDFGLAAMISDEAGVGMNVVAAAPLFSAAYSAPEVLSSRAGEIGPWTDIYSLTLVLLEVMRGEAIERPTSGSLRASSLGLSVPAPVEDLLARAVALDPRERPADARTFWSTLRDLARQSGPPDSVAAMLAATSYDRDLAAAMSKVRKASAANASDALPFAGTMVMVNAPNGGIRLLPAQNIAAGTGPKIDAPAVPLPPLAVTAGIVPPPSPLAASLGPGITSPVAPAPQQAIGGGSARPSAPAQRAQAIMAPVVHAQPPAPRTADPSNAGGGSAQQAWVPSAPVPSGPRNPHQPRGPALVIGLLVLLVLGVASVAGWLLLRPR